MPDSGSIAKRKKNWNLRVDGRSFEQDRWTERTGNWPVSGFIGLHMIFMTMPHEGVGIWIPCGFHPIPGVFRGFDFDNVFGKICG